MKSTKFYWTKKRLNLWQRFEGPFTVKCFEAIFMAGFIAGYHRYRSARSEALESARKRKRKTASKNKKAARAAKNKKAANAATNKRAKK